jgi:hypothetical protein
MAAEQRGGKIGAEQHQKRGLDGQEILFMIYTMNKDLLQASVRFCAGRVHPAHRLVLNRPARSSDHAA